MGSAAIRKKPHSILCALADPDPASGIEDRGSRIEDAAWRTESQGSRIEDRESKIEDPGSRIEGRGSRTEDLFLRIEGDPGEDGMEKFRAPATKSVALEAKISSLGARIVEVLCACNENCCTSSENLKHCRASATESSKFCALANCCTGGKIWTLGPRIVEVLCFCNEECCTRGENLDPESSKFCALATKNCGTRGDKLEPRQPNRRRFVR